MTIDNSGWDQPDMFKRGRGRPRKSDAYVYRSVGLSPAEWEYLSTWAAAGSSPSSMLRELLERSAKMWPVGPCSAKERI